VMLQDHRIVHPVVNPSIPELTVSSLVFTGVVMVFKTTEPN